MLKEQLVYLRKKNMLSQEGLAEKLNVSRLTITKWESGVTFPTLEYLIDLSNVFNVTIDRLIKEEDCISDDHQEVNEDQLVSFLIKAKKQTYANDANKIEPLRIGTHDYHYSEGEYDYYDSFVGASFFSGQEIVYKNNQACWTMNYYGQVLDDDFKGDFLKETLMKVNTDSPLRGPEFYQKGEYTYTSSVTGNIDHFQGYEYIYYQNKKIYELKFHGGAVK